MAGRIEVYVHSDQVTPNKGMGAIEVCSQTDFAARTEEFIEFVNMQCVFVMQHLKLVRKYGHK